MNPSIKSANWVLKEKIKQQIDQKLKDPETKAKIDQALSQKKQEEKDQSQKSNDFRGSAFVGQKKVSKLGGQQPQASFTIGVYPLRDSFILDSGLNLHICNNKTWFLEGSYKPVNQEEPEEVFASGLSL